MRPNGGRGLSIGNLTSQFFANVMLDPFDHFVTDVLRPGGYVRSMDDFLLYGESRSQLREMGHEVRERLACFELQIHPDKYRLVRTRDGVDFVGFRVFADGRIRLREKSLGSKRGRSSFRPHNLHFSDKMKSCRHKRCGYKFSHVGASFQLALPRQDGNLVATKRCGCKFSHVGASFQLAHAFDKMESRRHKETR